jgi:hypothetical protein
MENIQNRGPANMQMKINSVTRYFAINKIISMRKHVNNHDDTL